MSATPCRESDAPKIPPGTRVRVEKGKWAPKNFSSKWEFVEGWMGLPWAEVKTGTTVSDIEAQGGMDWKARGCAAWAVPDWATGVRWDGEDKPTWHRSSLLVVIGFVQEDPNQLEMFT